MVTADVRAPAAPLLRAGLWLLPVHAALLAVGTLTHQPDPGTEFDAYARYVTTPTFLASHLLASVLGAALGVLGVVAAVAVLVRGRSARSAVVALALFTVGSTASTAVFGAAAFAQPAIGRAHLRGVVEAGALDADVYGPALVLTAVAGVLLLLAGAVVLGTAVARSGPDLRLAGVTYAVAFALFLVTGFVLTPAQPVMALVATVAAAVIALRLPARRPGAG